jgi:hypothetical protein
MKKSSYISLTLWASAAALFTGCSRQYQVKRCVDPDGFAVTEDKCIEEDRNPYPYGPRPYRWNYGGSGGYNYGDRIFGGSSTPVEGEDSVSAHDAASATGARGGSGTVSRGGFGSSFGGEGGHGSGGHGGGE